MKYVKLILTNNCNQSCNYCYQIKDKKRMSWVYARKAIDYFVDNCNEQPSISFYGGEPLLEFELMQKCIEYSYAKFIKKDLTPKYLMTTNGSLLTEEIIDFCKQYNLKITLSMDGDKNAHEIGRGVGTFKSARSALALLQNYADLSVNIVAVVSPSNVHLLHDSVQYLLEQGLDELLLTFQFDEIWNKNSINILSDLYEKSYKLLVKERGKNKSFTFYKYTPPPYGKPLFQCNAGENGFVVTPDGYLFGCYMLIPWSKSALKYNTLHRFNDFCLGHLKSIYSTDFNKKRNNLICDKRLIGQYFRSTPNNNCSSCEFVTQCTFCPAIALIYSTDYCQIPQWVCEIKKILYITGRNSGQISY